MTTTAHITPTHSHVEVLRIAKVRGYAYCDRCCTGFRSDARAPVMSSSPGRAVGFGTGGDEIVYADEEGND